MTTQLPERLRELADDAPSSLSAAGLWRDGRRRHRRRMATAAAAVGVLVALTAGAGVGDWQSRRPEPASPGPTQGGPMSIPDRLYNPSPWTPTTRTPGRLVAVGSATRNQFPLGSDRNAVFGVVAGTQAYRFVDLPGQAPQEPDAYLSPDGLHLAYWIAPTGGSPSMNPGALAGIAVLDVVTGKVERHEVHTRFGLAVQSLAWVDADTVALVAGHFDSVRPMDFSSRDRTYFFTVGKTSGYAALAPADVFDVPVTTSPARGCAQACPGLYAQVVGRRRLQVYDAGAAPARSSVRLSTSLLSVAYDVPRGLVAGTQGPDDGSGPVPGPLVVGHRVGDRVRLSAVPGGTRYQQVFVWVDAAHVTASRQTRNGIVYDLVDVRTGARQQLTTKPWYAYEVAIDALRHPATVPGVAPPSPWSPRLVALAVLLAVACAVAVVVVARRSGVRA